MPSKLNPKIWTDTERKCRTCDVFKPYDNFHKQKGKVNGIEGQCKICCSASTQRKHSRKQYRLDNKEKIQEQKKQYILDNKQKTRDYTKQYNYWTRTNPVGILSRTYF